MNMLQKQERTMNLIMFMVWGFLLPISACIFVILFLGGTIVDTVVLIMSVVAITIKLFEKTLGEKAKYLYASIMPVCGAIVIVVGNDGKFMAMTQAYFLATLMIIAYYDKKLVLFNSILTLVVNLFAMIIFTDAYLKLHSVIVWIFISIVYILVVITSYCIAQKTLSLFVEVEAKERNLENLLKGINVSIDNIKDSSEHIYGSLNNFEKASQEIAASTEQIKGSADNQINKVSDSIQIFNELSKKITDAQAQILETVTEINELKDKNNEGIAAISMLSKKIEENITSTKNTSEGVMQLSNKSRDISGIIESINDISSQTNLLALNASIEAARAGEAGKGFAVVASEINVLSQASSESTREIDTILKDITSTVESTASIMSINAKNIASSSNELDDTVKVFNIMLQTSEKVIDIASKLQEELESVSYIKEELLQAMKGVENISQESAQTANEISASTVQQVTEVEKIIASMEQVKKGMDGLSDLLAVRDA